MSRLSDDELDEALAVAQSLNSLRLTAAVAELRERRALDAQRMATVDEIVRRRNEDLTAEEICGLRALAYRLNKHSHEPYVYDGEECEAGIAALAKILAGGGR
jgi:hypothetical protein